MATEPSEVEDLKRQLQKEKQEHKGAIERAQKRWTVALHANRRAERAEQDVNAHQILLRGAYIKHDREKLYLETVVKQQQIDLRNEKAQHGQTIQALEQAQAEVGPLKKQLETERAMRIASEGQFQEAARKVLRFQAEAAESRRQADEAKKEADLAKKEVESLRREVAALKKTYALGQKRIEELEMQAVFLKNTLQQRAEDSRESPQKMVSSVPLASTSPIRQAAKKRKLNPENSPLGLGSQSKTTGTIGSPSSFTMDAPSSLAEPMPPPLHSVSPVQSWPQSPHTRPLSSQPISPHQYARPGQPFHANRQSSDHQSSPQMPQQRNPFPLSQFPEHANAMAQSQTHSHLTQPISSPFQPRQPQRLPQPPVVPSQQQPVMPQAQRYDIPGQLDSQWHIISNLIAERGILTPSASHMPSEDFQGLGEDSDAFAYAMRPEQQQQIERQRLEGTPGVVFPQPQQVPPLPAAEGSVARAARAASAAPKQTREPVACLNCHKYYWNETCSGEPCDNCILSGEDCCRPQCEHFESPELCAKGNKCPRVHQTDPYTVFKKAPKSLRRKIKKEETSAWPAPALSRGPNRGGEDELE